MEFKISIAKDFSTTPGARYYKDGKYSGEEFYETKLKNKFQESLAANEKLIVDLDGTEGYATSFLDESFRRLALDFGPDIVLSNLILISNDEPDCIDEIKDYITEASKK